MATEVRDSSVLLPNTLEELDYWGREKRSPCSGGWASAQEQTSLSHLGKCLSGQGGKALKWTCGWSVRPEDLVTTRHGGTEAACKGDGIC